MRLLCIKCWGASLTINAPEQAIAYAQTAHEEKTNE